jgi:hypothetical protein
VPKDKPILTYCTGGIRCIKVGAFLKQELGFDNVNRLEGGIISYARYLREQTQTPADEEAAARAEAEAEAEAKVKQAQQRQSSSSSSSIIPGSKFKGVNYVFDNRLGERITEDVLSACDQCGTPSDLHVNCANPSCHVRFIQCSACGARYGHCCSRGCREAAEDAAAAEATKGAYPAPRKTIYPAELLDAQGQEAEGVGVGGTRRGGRRPWLSPGPFQNSRLNRAFDDAIDEYAAAHTTEVRDAPPNPSMPCLGLGPQASPSAVKRTPSTPISPMSSRPACPVLCVRACVHACVRPFVHVRSRSCCGACGKPRRRPSPRARTWFRATCRAGSWPP